MSAPITEAHRALAEKLGDLLDIEQMTGPSPAEQAAQLIADSEAQAVVAAHAVTAVYAERDQLRAEVERLKKQAVFDGDHIHALNAAFATRAEVTDANARAEKAEAELAAERARLDWLLLDNLTRFDDSISHRTAIDAAMQKGEK